MYITVSQLAAKVNNLERFNPEELKMEDPKIKKIVVRVVNYENIYYTVKRNDGEQEEYNEQNVPCNVISLINRNRPVFNGKTGENETTYIYIDLIKKGGA